VVVDFETFFDKKMKYDLRSMSVTEYVRDGRFWPHGMAYRFLDDERTHWLAGMHPIEAWAATVDWENTVVVAHNVRFDGAILSWRFRVKPFAWMDTVGLAKAVLGENVSGYSLKRLAEYLGLPAKGEISCDGVLKPSSEQLAVLGEYCKNDVEICKEIYEKLIRQFPPSQLSAMDWTIRAFVEPRLALDEECLRKGVEDEKKRREEIIFKTIPEIHSYRVKLEKEWYDSFEFHEAPFEEPKTTIEDAKNVLSSNKQFAEYLVSQGIQVPTKQSIRTRQPIPAFAQTDEGMDGLRVSAPNLHAARIASKSNLLETRGESLLAVAKTGLFPFDVGFSGAVQTHRYSGGSGAGGNPQNFTRNSFLRGAVRSPKGYKLVVGDFAAIELRLLAWLAKEPRLMGKIINDEDIYADFASLKYGRKITRANKSERQFGKCSILGLGYNMGAKKFKFTVKTQTGMEISEKDAWKTVDLYRTTYFNVPKLWEQAHALLSFIATGKIGCIWFAPFIKVRKNALILPSGLEIKYPNLRQIGDEWVYDVYRKVYVAEPTKLYGGKMVENICQALAGELCREAIERAEADGIKCVGQVHDEIIAIAEEGGFIYTPEEAKIALKRHMEQAPKWMPTLRLRAEVGYGDDWNSAKV